MRMAMGLIVSFLSSVTVSLDDYGLINGAFFQI